MVEFYLTIAVSILRIVIPYAIVRYDRGRLDAARRARAWNQASFACAVYFFGPLCLPAHFWVTRRKPLALLQGALVMVLVLGVEYAVASLFEQALA